MTTSLDSAPRPASASLQRSERWADDLAGEARKAPARHRARAAVLLAAVVVLLRLGTGVLGDNHVAGRAAHRLVVDEVRRGLVDAQANLVDAGRKAVRPGQDSAGEGLGDPLAGRRSEVEQFPVPEHDRAGALLVAHSKLPADRESVAAAERDIAGDDGAGGGVREGD